MAGTIRTTFKAAALCLGAFFCAFASAQGDGGAPRATQKSTAKPGIADQILAGERRGLPFGPYIWRVLELREDRALLITEAIVEKRNYHASLGDPTWETCDLRKYLNGRFLEKFSEIDLELVLETVVQNPDNPKSGAKGGDDTADRVFLLSLDEAQRYFEDDEDRKATYEGGIRWWWLRTPGHNNNHGCVVGFRGPVGIYGETIESYNGGLRPAVWLKLK